MTTAATRTPVSTFEIEDGQRFELRGRRQVFRVTRRFLAAGFIPSVEGVTLDGRSSARARIADVVWLAVEN